MQIRLAATVAFLIGMSSSSQAIALADGYYDSTWIGSGRIAFGADLFDTFYPSEVRQVLLEPGGNLLLAGLIYRSPDKFAWLGELHADGTWVATFGVDSVGLLVLCELTSNCKEADGPDGFGAVVLQPDSKLLITTNSRITRVLAGGLALDTAGVSGGLGYVGNFFQIDNLGGFVIAANALAVQPDGKILAAGPGYDSISDTVPKLGIVRLNADLSLDTTFNHRSVGGRSYQGGVRIQASGSDLNEVVTDVLVQPDGAIVLVGQGIPQYPDSPELEVIRLDSTGALDPQFATGGISALTWAYGPIDGVGRSVLDRAGRIVTVASGSDTLFGHDDIIVGRLSSAGLPDIASNFVSGFAAIPPSNGCDSIDGTALGIDSAGRILLTGVCDVISTSANYFVMTRMRGDTGYLDTTFGIGGYGLGAFAAADTLSYAYALAFDGTGHPVVGGYASNLAGVSRLTYDLVFTNNFEPAPDGCLPPDCN